MNCEQYRAAIPAHSRGQLSPELTAQVEQHHRECGLCVGFNRTHAELLCSDFVRFLDSYVENAISHERRAIFERHMTVCPDCSAYLDSYRRTIAFSADSAQVPEDAVPEELILAILNASNAR